LTSNLIYELELFALETMMKLTQYHVSTKLKFNKNHKKRNSHFACSHVRIKLFPHWKHKEFEKQKHVNLKIKNGAPNSKFS